MWLTARRRSEKQEILAKCIHCFAFKCTFMMIHPETQPHVTIHQKERNKTPNHYNPQIHALHAARRGR